VNAKRAFVVKQSRTFIRAKQQRADADRFSFAAEKKEADGKKKK